jgi:hypothetical protein
VLVGGQGAHHRVGIVGEQVHGGQPERRGGIAPDRLGQHLAVGRVLAYQVGVLLGGHHHHDAVDRGARPPHRRRQQRFARAQIEELLGPPPPARRPQPRPAPARQDHRVSHRDRCTRKQ